MTKKHFEAIADCVKTMKFDLDGSKEPLIEGRCRKIVAGALADCFAKQNSRFSRTMFYRGCGIRTLRGPGKTDEEREAKLLAHIETLEARLSELDPEVKKDKPEQGKKYSLSELAKTGKWKDSEVKDENEDGIKDVEF